MAQNNLIGFDIPVYQALSAPILIGGAPRSVAILNGTLAAAMGLGLQQWLAGLCLFVIGHSAAALAARRDPDFMPVLLRHLRQKGWWRC